LNKRIKSSEFSFLFWWGCRLQDKTELWKQLCAEAAVEQDPQRLLELTRQINDLLLGKQRRIERSGDESAAQNQE
jgi:hypothetical protein